MRRTRDAAQRIGRAAEACPDGDRPRAGVLYVVPAAAVPGVEWLITDATRSPVEAVAVDAAPFLRPDDLELDTELGPMAVRCDTVVPLGVDALRDAAPSVAIPSSRLEPVRARIRAVRAATRAAPELDSVESEHFDALAAARRRLEALVTTVEATG